VSFANFTGSASPPHELRNHKAQRAISLLPARKFGVISFELSSSPKIVLRRNLLYCTYIYDVSSRDKYLSINFFLRTVSLIFSQKNHILYPFTAIQIMRSVSTITALGALLPVASAFLARRALDDPASRYLSDMCYPLFSHSSRAVELHLSANARVSSLANSPLRTGTIPARHLYHQWHYRSRFPGRTRISLQWCILGGLSWLRHLLPSSTAGRL
jgi:hypothetical protein